MFSASLRQQLRVTAESYICQGPWPGLCVFCVKLRLGSHIALYTRREHTSGTSPHSGLRLYGALRCTHKLEVPVYEEEQLFYGNVQCIILRGL